MTTTATLAAATVAAASLAACGKGSEAAAAAGLANCVFRGFWTSALLPPVDVAAPVAAIAPVAAVASVVAAAFCYCCCLRCEALKCLFALICSRR